ncbi:MAG: response regulator [Oscillospiraceae bacterium]|nr:response regulator [Oscillospiraceae bacterium]
MYKVFFVDDEASMRTGIRESVDWDNSDFTLSGEAPDGELALSFMQEIMPDILIADIRMPFMDGLELSKRAKKAMPWIKIIILSGHDEFEYAKQAIEIGVDAYLLKPVTPKTLMETLNDVATKIDKERRSNVEKLIDSVQDVGTIGLIPTTEINKLPMIDKLRYASQADVPGFVSDYLDSFEIESITSFIFISYVVMDVLLSASKIIDELGGNAKEVLAKYADISNLINADSGIETIKALLSSILESVIEYRDDVTGSKNHEVITKAQEYIQKNYSEKDISLHSVAKEVNVSPNHFSTIFSQKIGETFISYITKIRLERAKILLKTTNKRISDIGYEVGYNDTQYFSYVFKKNIGMTPKAFRNK